MENSDLTTSNKNQFTVILKSNTISFNHPISIKLDDKNYLLWKQQVMSTICGHELEKFIASPRFWPEKYDSAEKEVTDEISKEYQLWKKQDHFIISWLLLSMSETMLTHVVGCDKAYQIWIVLRLKPKLRGGYQGRGNRVNGRGRGATTGMVVDLSSVKFVTNPGM